MSLINCHECQEEISDAAESCPHCGAKKKKSGKLPWIMVALIVLILLFSAAANNYRPDEKSKARDAIRLCWQEYEKKSLSAGEKQFVASACEKMEREFKSGFHENP